MFGLFNEAKKTKRRCGMSHGGKKSYKKPVSMKKKRGGKRMQKRINSRRNHKRSSSRRNSKLMSGGA